MGVVLAVLNLLNVDGETQSQVADAIESILLLAGALVVRQRVTPLRKLEGGEDA